MTTATTASTSVGITTSAKNGTVKLMPEKYTAVLSLTM